MNRRLRIVLALVLAVALTPLLIVAIAQTIGEVRDEQRRQSERLTAIAAAVGDDLEAALARAQGVVDAVGVRGYDPTRPSASCDSTMVRALASGPIFSNLAIVNLEGEVTCSALSAGEGLSVDAHDWFRELRNGADTAVSNVIEGELTGRPIIVVASRIDVEGRFAGAAAAGVDVVHASHLLRLEGLSRGARVALIDAGGRVVLGPNVDPDLIVETVPAEFAERLTTLEGPTPVRYRDEGRPLVGVLSPIIERKLGVLLVSPPEIVHQWGVWDIAATFMVPFLMYVLALTSVWLAVDFFVLRWLGYLRRIAAIYAGGRLDVQPVRARRAPYEFQELADTLADMASSLEDQRTELEAAVEQRSALLREIHHRVKNNLQIIVSLLNLQAGRLAGGEARDALMEARRRINALSLVHRSLYEADDLRAVHMPGFLTELTRNLRGALSSDERSVTLTSESDEVWLEPDQAVPIALFVSEAVTNAFKHAFVGRTSGVIAVRLSAASPEHLTLTVSDDGVGLAEDAAGGTGSSLMQAFALQLGGEYRVEANEPAGARCVLTVGETVEPAED